MKANNSLGVAGVASRFSGVRLMVLKIIDSGGDLNDATETRENFRGRSNRFANPRHPVRR
eukprot:2624662-Amphidinium_carterae.1